MRNDEARMRRPGIDRKAALLTHSTNVVAIEYDEGETEPLIEFYKKQDLLKTIPGKGGIDEIFAKVRKALAKSESFA